MRIANALLGSGAAMILAAASQATPIVELVSPSGDNTIEILAGDTFTLELRVTAGPEGVSSYGISAEFDSDGLDAFDVVSATELLPGAFDFNLAPGVDAIVESSLGFTGQVLTCEAAALGPGAASQTFTACEIELQSTGVLGSFALDPGLYNVFVDGLFDSDGNDVSGSATFQGATVQVVPEAGTLALVALGLPALALLARGRAPRRRPRQRT